MTWEGLTPPYGTIVIDPPWSYKSKPLRRFGEGRDASEHYSTMTMEEIAALPVSELPAENAHLYLWVTNPHLYGDDGVTPYDMLQGWGFRYITCLTWLKTGGIGMGFYYRGDTEHVLFGVRGKAPIPPDKRARNWFAADKKGHSAKPPAFYDTVEAVSPGPFVDIFCRQPRFGWDSWGHGYEQVTA